MGAGCYYTNKESGTKAFWIDSDCDCEYDCNCMDFLHEDIKSSLLSLGYEESFNAETVENGLYKIYIESDYYGNSLIIRQEPLVTEPYYTEDIRVYTLAMNIFDRCYYSLAKKLSKLGYKLRIATNGWTSAEFKPT